MNGGDADLRFRHAFESAPIGIALVDFGTPAGDRISEVNRALCELTGRTGPELVGLPLAALCLAEDADIDEPLRRRMMAGEIDRYEVQKRALLASDRLAWFQLNVSRVSVAGSLRSTGIAQVQDITERKRFEDELRHVANHDPLTGLMNRRRFQEELDQQLSLIRRHGGTSALLVADVDDLKEVNDSAGHGTGDAVLRHVADALRGRMRSTDAVARLAGDEFAVLMRNCGTLEAQAVSEGLIAQLLRTEVEGRPVSVSIGVTELDASKGLGAGHALASADAAMYRAKRRGGAAAEPLDTPAVEQPRERAAVPPAAVKRSPQDRLVGRVRAALAANRLMVFAQPIVDLRTGQADHHELLVRMQGESGAVLPAAEFLAVAAQEPGLCAEIDLWVARSAVALLQGHYGGSRLQVNLSGQSLADERAITRLCELVSASSIAGDSLAFEIPEGFVLRDEDRAVDAATRLVAAGSPAVIDGFAGSFESYDYLERLPVDQIKLDGPVIRGLAADPPDHTMTRAIVGLARGLKLNTVAKLVDRDTMAPLLRMHGVDRAQGFAVGKPEPVTSDRGPVPLGA